MSGKVVVNRCMSLDGFIAGPGHSMDWGDGRALADFVAPDDVAGQDRDFRVRRVQLCVRRNMGPEKG